MWVSNCFRHTGFSKQELFKTVNVQTGCCADCPYKQLNKMERRALALAGGWVSKKPSSGVTRSSRCPFSPSFFLGRVPLPK